MDNFVCYSCGKPLDPDGELWPCDGQEMSPGPYLCGTCDQTFDHEAFNNN